MATVGISVRIDMKKIDEKRIYKGQKGDYLDLTTFVNLDEKDQYGNNGFVSQSVSKEEREAKEAKTYLGNVQVVWTNGSVPQPTPRDGQPMQQSAPVANDDLPF